MLKREKAHSQISAMNLQGTDVSIVEIAKEENCNIYRNGMDDGYHQYGNDWWGNPDCPYEHKYISIDSMYPPKYFGGDTGHPNDFVASQIYDYMQSVYQSVFKRNFYSIIELGTGGGEITRQFCANKLDYIAVEGTKAGAKKLIQNGISEDRIINDNLKFLNPVGRTFDIAMCTEVAEHIEPFFASKVVDNCIKHSEVVWFSAADRNRRAHYHHINEIHIEAWDNLFAHMGYPFFIILNDLHGRASRMYFSERLGKAMKTSGRTLNF